MSAEGLGPDEDGFYPAIQEMDQAAGSLLSLGARLDSIIYATRPDPERLGISTAYLCPPVPVGCRLEVRTIRGAPPRWKHAPMEVPDGRADARAGAG